MSRPVTVWLLIGLVLGAFVLAGRRDQCACQLPSCSLAWATENTSSGEQPAQGAASQPSAHPASTEGAAPGNISEGTPPAEQPASSASEKPSGEASPPAAGQPEAQPQSPPAPASTEPAPPSVSEAPAAPQSQPQPSTSAPTEQAPPTVPVSPEQPPGPQPKVEQPAVERPIPNLAEIIAKLRQQEPGKYRPIGEICQVKTYRVETLHGFGLVVDLTELARSVGASGRLSQPGITSLGSVLKPGTGVTSAEPFRKGELLSAADLKAALALLDRTADEELLQAIPESLWERRAVTLVTVTVNIPPEGAHQGDRLDCQVRSFEPKSLSGGFLLPTKLYPPGPRDKAPVGIAAGPVVTESTLRAGGDRVVGGCLVQQDIQEEFVRDGKIRLLLKPEHASFLVAQDIADRINVELGLFAGKPIARALSSSAIEVEVPPGFDDNPVGFVTQVLRLPSSVPVEQSTTGPLRSTIPEGRR